MKRILHLLALFAFSLSLTVGPTDQASAQSWQLRGDQVTRQVFESYSLADRKHIQRVLQEYGLYGVGTTIDESAIDGKVGPKTLGALNFLANIWFQKKWGLEYSADPLGHPQGATIFFDDLMSGEIERNVGYDEPCDPECEF